MTDRVHESRLLLFCLALLPVLAAGGDIPNVQQVPGTLLNGPIAPEQGRTAIIAYHGGRIISVPEPPGSQPGADLRVRIVNISDPANPQITVMPYQAGGFNSHGYFHYGRYLFIGGHEVTPGSGTFRDSLYMASPGLFEERNMEPDAGLPIGTYSKSGSQSPWGVRHYWSYGDISGPAFVAIRRSIAEYTHDWNNGGAPTGPAVKSNIDLLGQTGVVGMPFIMGNILVFASDQTGTGVATYDISDPANPILLDVLKEQNPGGYWPEVYGHYIFFPRRDGEGGPNSRAGFMVVDFSDPTNLRVVANRNLPGSNQYVTFQDEYAFMNNYKIDMRTFEPVLTLPTNGVTLDASQFALPVGNLVITGGYGTMGPGLAIWAHQAEPDTRGPFVAYHVPANDQTNYSRVCSITLSIPETLRTETIVNGSTLIVRPVGGNAIDCWHSFGQNKLLTVTPIQPLAANTTYEVILTSGIQDAVGNAMEPHSFRFSTGSIAGGNRAPVATALSANPAPVAPNTSMDFTATASDPDGDAIEYRFDFGDGTPKTAWSNQNTASHTYTSAKHYQVSVQVRDGSGALSSFSRGITVASAPTGP
ncbi:MAG TPA: PKD domain-containing protein, partial [Planctomycetota bacterium]|nr:PKD domain-containing protein [Planctomycetota bacterium]